uniref:RING-type domain-containing protein n=1 Tax=Steinernema glaseri TaxID=37863 RepID=A0A1I8AM50_9BILA
MDLKVCTVEDITNEVVHLGDMRGILDGAEDGEAIYLLGLDKDDDRVLWKMETLGDPSDTVRDDFCCGICLQLFEAPKVLPCGHSICAGCESMVGVENGLNAKELTCPFCRKSVVLGAGETLPMNYALQSVIESSMTSLRTREDPFLCSTCRTGRKREHCRTCTGGAKRVDRAKKAVSLDVLLWGTCEILKFLRGQLYQLLSYVPLLPVVDGHRSEDGDDC